MSEKLMVVGLPPTTNTKDIDELTEAKQSFLAAKVIPMRPQLVKSFRVFQLVPPEKGDPAKPDPMLIYFQPTQIQDTFTNELSDHFLSQLLKTGERLGQIAQTAGISSEDITNNEFGKFLSSMAPDILKKAGSAIATMLTGERFDLPKMWGDSRAELTKDIRIRLHCHNPSNDEEYKEHIVKPLINLLKFVLPVYTLAEHYKWPYFCKVDAPGLFILPEAMITSLTIDKGTGVLFGYNNRPGEVEVNIQFTSVRNVVINDTGKTTDITHKLSVYERNLMDKKQSLSMNITTEKISGNVKTRSTTIPSKTISSSTKSTHERLKSLA